MDTERIVDYFVQAGIPLAGAEPLVDVSQEAMPHLVHQKDPIVELAVINRTLGEEPPPGFTCIEGTPYGLPADLNHGSLRAPEMYLCLRRGTDLPPLTDIGWVPVAGKYAVNVSLEFGVSLGKEASTSCRIIAMLYTYNEYQESYGAIVCLQGTVRGQGEGSQRMRGADDNGWWSCCECQQHQQHAHLHHHATSSSHDWSQHARCHWHLRHCNQQGDIHILRFLCMYVYNHLLMHFIDDIRHYLLYIVCFNRVKCLLTLFFKLAKALIRAWLVLLTCWDCYFLLIECRKRYLWFALMSLVFQLGSDVYLCYKKSALKGSSIVYKPGIGTIHA